MIGASRTFETSYTVTEADILAGEVVNTATATGTDPDGDDPTVVPGVDTELTEDKNAHLTVLKITTSRPANGRAYALGETISYQITVTNDGNVTISNITVTDALTGDSWPVGSLTVGASRTFETSYTVTEADVVAGSVTNTATATGEDPDGEVPTVVPGVDTELVEEPLIPLTIIAASDTKIYDGTPLTNANYTVVGALAEGHRVASVTVTGSQTEVGQSDNVPSNAVILNAAGEDVTALYDITYVNGILEVTERRALIITAATDEKIYDGTPLTNDGYIVSGELASGDRVVSVDVNGSQTEVGSSDNVPSNAVILNAAGVDVTDTYIITYVNGTLTVTALEVIITADSATKVYDGTPLTDDGWMDTPPVGLLAGDTVVAVTVTGSRTEVGSSPNVPSDARIVNVAGEDVTNNYVIRYVDGTLTVTQLEVVITADSATKGYDGTPLTDDGWMDTPPTGLLAGDTVVAVTVIGSRTEVGSSPNVPSDARIVNALGEDVTNNYIIRYVEGTLTVTELAVTIIAASAQKVYDGVPLTNGNYTAVGLRDGDRVAFVTITGSRLPVGESPNVPSNAIIVNAAGEDVTATYIINYVNGTLTVTPATLVITAGSARKVYDGTALTNGSYTAAGLATGDRIASIFITGSRTQVGSSPNVPSDALIINALGQNVTGNYIITYVNGTLTVTDEDDVPRVIILTDIDDFETPLGLGATYTNLGDCIE